MSFDLLQKLQEYRSEAQPKQKLQQSLIKVQSQRKNKSEFSIQSLKQDLTKNQKRIYVKSAIQNIPLSPTRLITPTLKNPLSPSQFKSPYRPYTKKNSDQKPISFRAHSPIKKLDSTQCSSQLKLYSAKYHRVMGEEQGIYYSQLQAKLDKLADIIGSNEDHHQHVYEIENVINQSKIITHKSNLQKELDYLHNEKRAIQSDLQNINYKISRFSDVTDI